MAAKFQYDHPDDALLALAERLQPAPIQTAVDQVDGRTLAQGVIADRDSPAGDVSAMDGYALRMADLRDDIEIPVKGESAPGSPPPPLEPGSAVRIFTGAIVPPGCQVVIKREDTQESPDSIRLTAIAVGTAEGEHIRRAGENAAAGSEVLAAGTPITAAVRATMANFGRYAADVSARVRVAIITSGNEVGLFTDTAPAAWQLRNSNRFSILSVLAQPWLHVVRVEHCLDDAEATAATLAECLGQADAVILTGGVSMGDYDYIPSVVRQSGGNVVFHGLPIRPGKPILGAATEDGKLVLGLPGNPVSATIGCHRFGIPLLAKLSGRSQWNPPCPVVHLEDPGDKTIPLHWLRLVHLTSDGTASAVISQGSGDLVSLGHSSGYVQLPPGASGPGPWPYRSWL